ncbi:hypothetical protein [Microbacterium sp. NPDC055683]
MTVPRLEIDPATLLAWLLPAAVVFGGAAAIVVLVTWITKRARRGRRARTKTTTALDGVGAALVALDDDLDELELEIALSGALYDGDPPASLRRARMSAQHTRDDAFSAYRALREDDRLPAHVRRDARTLRTRVDAAIQSVAAARDDHREWTRTHAAAADQVAAARGRLAALRARTGDPAALLAELAERADRAEWADAEAAADRAGREIEAADESLRAAADKAADPSASALADLAAAERALRSAERGFRVLEERHRIVVQSAQAVAGELTGAAGAIRSATGIRAALPPPDADRLGREIDAAARRLDELRAEAQARPVHVNEEIARLRDRLDRALADARTVQQRLLGARGALPGTLAAARSALARAEAAVQPGASLEARVRLDAARDELARARQAHDPVAALDDARRAIRHAEDAQALATPLRA